MDTAPSAKITHEWLWPTVGKFMRSKDVVVTETGGRFRVSISSNYRNGEFWYSREQVPARSDSHFTSLMGEVHPFRKFQLSHSVSGIPWELFLEPLLLSENCRMVARGVSCCL